MSVVPAPGPLPVVGDGDADDWPIIGVLKESGDPSLPCGGSSGPIAGMNRASRGVRVPGSGAGNLSAGASASQGLPVRKPVDDLCKGATNLCVTWG